MTKTVASPFLKNPIQPGDGDKRHGTPGGYTNHRCRCELCCEANTISMRAQRARRKRSEPPVHGRPSSYTNWGCRCPECREAHRVNRAAYVARTRESS